MADPALLLLLLLLLLGRPVRVLGVVGLGAHVDDGGAGAGRGLIISPAGRPGVLGVLVGEDPGVLGDAALGGVDDEAPLGQSHAGEAAGQDPDVRAVVDGEGAQVRVAGRGAPVSDGGDGGELDDGLGDPAARVLENLGLQGFELGAGGGRADDDALAAGSVDELELSPLAEAPAPLGPGGPSHRVVVPALLDAEGRAELTEDLAARPWAWCARERVAPWAVPDSLHPGGTEAPAAASGPAPTGVLRTLTLGGPGERLVMPGGVVVLDPAAGSSATEPTRVRDVWVMDAADRPTAPALDRPVRYRPPRPAEATAATGPGRKGPAAARRPGALPLSRSAAQDLYWFGRYAERGESTARLALVAQDLVEDSSEHPGTDGFVAMSVLLDAIDAVTAVHGEEAGRSLATREAAGPTAPREHLRALVLDAGRRGPVRYSARRAVLAAGQVRDLRSEDTWIVLARLEELLAEAEGLPLAGPPSMARVLGEVLELRLALTGVTADGLVRDASWAYLDAGRRVERAQETLRILRAVAADQRADGASALIEAVARSRNSVISLRRRLAEDPAGLSGLDVGLDLLLSDPSNPRSVLLQLERLREDLAHMPSLSLDGAIGVPLDALTVLDVARAASDRAHLTAVLAELEEGVRAVSAVLDATAFRAQRSHRIVQEVR